jgi:hypothetical protein
MMTSPFHAGRFFCPRAQTYPALAVVLTGIETGWKKKYTPRKQ